MKTAAIIAFIVLGWIAEAEAGGYSFQYLGDTTLNISLGTPDQGPFEFHWDPIMSKFFNLKPLVTDKSHGGFFNPNASSTFKYKGKVGERGDFTGTETLKLANGPQFDGIDIDVRQSDNHYGEVALSHGENGKPSFMDRVLKHLGGTRTVVLAIKDSGEGRHYGTIVLGDDKPHVCQPHWSTYPARPQSYIQMTITVAEVQIGDWHQNGEIPLAFSRDYIWLDAKTYAAAVRELKVSESGDIDCNTKASITVATAGHKFILNPKDYIQEYSDGCEFNVFKSAADAIMLPLRFLNKKCLLFNFDRNIISIGLTK